MNSHPANVSILYFNLAHLSVVEIETGRGVEQIQRRDGERRVRVTADRR